MVIVNYTKRYRLGQLLSTLTRHFLLMTATPHNGKEADFQLFMPGRDRLEAELSEAGRVTALRFDPCATVALRP